MKIEIVKFEDGTYAVRRKCGFWIFSWYECLTKWNDYWFDFKENRVEKYCKFFTESEARERLQKYLTLPSPDDHGVPVDKL